MDVLEVLLREYEQLRQEILVKQRAQFESVAIIWAGVVIAQGATGRGWKSLMVIALIGVLVAATSWLLLGRGIRNCARRNREIEARIQTDLDDPFLLLWESSKPRTGVNKLFR